MEKQIDNGMEEKIYSRAIKKNEDEFVLRSFLNENKFCNGAAIKIHLSNKNKSYQISISDCSRHILLHGGFKTKEPFENAIYKIDTLVFALEIAKKQITEMYNASKDDALKSKKNTKSKTKKVLYNTGKYEE